MRRKQIILLFLGLCPLLMLMAQRPDYVYRNIASTDELLPGDTVILAVESGGATPCVMALGAKGENADISSHIQRQILLPTSSWESLVFTVGKVDNAFTFSYQTDNLRFLAFNYLNYAGVCHVTSTMNASDAYSQWSINRLTATGRYNVYTSSLSLTYGMGTFFGAYGSYDQVIHRENLDQSSGTPTTSTHGAQAITIFKKYPCYILTYDCKNGTCEVAYEYGGSEALPKATKAGKTFMGWVDAEGRVYEAGARYPASGALTEDRTLTAEFRDVSRSYEQIKNTLYIKDGDILVLTMEDGDGNPSPERHGLCNVDNQVYLNISEQLDHTTVTDAYRFKATRSSDNDNAFYLYNFVSQYYVYPTSGHSYSPVITTAVAPDENVPTLFSASSDGRHYYLSNVNGDNYGYSFLGMSNVSTPYLRKVQGSDNNQYTLNGGLGMGLNEAINAGYNPQSWTIYREITKFYPRIVFNVDALGVSTYDTIYTFSTILPDIIGSPQPGYSFGGWTDGNTTYPAGTTFTTETDITLSAISETIRAHFIVHPMKGLPIEEQLGTQVTMPSVIAQSGYRFLGWSTNPNAVQPDAQLEIGKVLTIIRSTFFYAVFAEQTVCYKYFPADLEEGGRYLIAFDHGAGQERGRVIGLTQEGHFYADTLDLTNAKSDQVFTYTRTSNGSLEFFSSTGYWLGNENGYLSTKSPNYSWIKSGSKGHYTMKCYNYNTRKNMVFCLARTSPTTLFETASYLKNQFSTKQTLEEIWDEGNYPMVFTLYRQEDAFAYHVSFDTYPDTTHLPVRDACTMWLPKQEDLSEPWAPILIGWATTPELAKAGVADVGEPGGYFIPDRDCMLYAVYRDVFYDIVDWRPNDITLQTMTHSSYSITQVIPDNPPVWNNMDSSAIDAGVYQLNTTPKILHPGQILDISFRDSDSLYVFTDIYVRIPYIIQGNRNTALLDEDTCAMCDLWVREGAKLLVDADRQFQNVVVCGGGKLVIPQGKTLRCKSLSLRGGDMRGGIYQYTYPQMVVNGTLAIENDSIYYDYLLNSQQQYTLALPVDVDTVQIRNFLGTKLPFGIADYSGYKRSQAQTGWAFTDDAVLKSGKGYTIYAQPDSVAPKGRAYVNQHFIRARLPMYVGSNFTEDTEQSVWVSEYTSSMAKGYWNWNLVGNPYFASFKGALMIDGTEQNYVTIPDNQGLTYQNFITRHTVLPAFKNFFVQAMASGALVFDVDARLTAPLRGDNPQERRTGLIMTHETDTTQVDRVGLLIGEQYTTDYELNADLDKWMNRTLSLYALSDGYRLAFDAVNPTTLAQGVAIGYRTAIAGNYTLGLDPDYDLSQWQSVVLEDRFTSQRIDLKSQPYAFVASKGVNDNRFILYAVPSSSVATDWDDVTAERQCYKFIEAGMLYIRVDGVLYNAQGQVVDKR